LRQAYCIDTVDPALLVAVNKLVAAKVPAFLKQRAG
jgi:hypothetical protein